MAHGLQVRVPYLDEQVWDVARRITTRMQLSGGTTKHVLRAAVADLLPPEVASRPKLGFPVPVSTWPRGPWGEGVAERISAGPLSTMLEPRVVTRTVTEHRDGRRDHGRTGWTLLVLSTWAEQTAAGDVVAGRQVRHEVVGARRVHRGRRDVLTVPRPCLLTCADPLAVTWSQRCRSCGRTYRRAVRRLS